MGRRRDTPLRGPDAGVPGKGWRLATNRPSAAFPGLAQLLETGTLAGLGDGELLDRYRCHDGPASGRAFAALVERHGGLVLRTCRAVLPDPDDAHDAFQVTFLVLARKAGTIRRRETLAAWLHGVALRTAASARGAIARRRRHERLASILTREAVPPREFDDSAAVLHEEVARLPDRLRVAVLICEFEGLPLAAAAARLGCPVGTVKSRLARARERLKLRLTARGLDPASEPWGQVKTQPLSPRLADETAAGVPKNHAGVVATSAAMAAWESAVLRGMFMSKLLKSLAAAGLVAGCLTTGVGLLARQPGSQAPAGLPPAGPNSRFEEQTKAEGVPPERADAGVPNLAGSVALARVDTIRELFELSKRRFEAGETDLESVCLTSVRLLDAQRDLSQATQDVLTATKGHSDRMTALEDEVRKLFEAGKASNADLLTVRSYRLEANLRLVELTSGEKPRVPDAAVNRQTDPARLDAQIRAYTDKIRDGLLKEKLDTPVSLDFPKPTPFGTVLKAARAISVYGIDTGLPIYVDPAGLQAAGKTIDTPIILLAHEVPLREALRRIAEAMGMTYGIAEGMITLQ